MPDADDMLLKSALAIELRRRIETRGLSQTAAAKRIGIGQPDLSRLLRGRLRGFAAERLMRMSTAFGQDVEIAVRPHGPARADGSR